MAVTVAVCSGSPRAREADAGKVGIPRYLSVTN